MAVKSIIILIPARQDIDLHLPDALMDTRPVKNHVPAEQLPEPAINATLSRLMILMNAKAIIGKMPPAHLGVVLSMRNLLIKITTLGAVIKNTVRLTEVPVNWSTAIIMKSSAAAEQTPIATPICPPVVRQNKLN